MDRPNAALITVVTVKGVTVERPEQPNRLRPAPSVKAKQIARTGIGVTRAGLLATGLFLAGLTVLHASSRRSLPARRRR